MEAVHGHSPDLPAAFFYSHLRIGFAHVQNRQESIVIYWILRILCCPFWVYSTCNYEVYYTYVVYQCRISPLCGETLARSGRLVLEILRSFSATCHALLDRFRWISVRIALSLIETGRAICGGPEPGCKRRSVAGPRPLRASELWGQAGPYTPHDRAPGGSAPAG
jgi:hypothetical protein